MRDRSIRVLSRACLLLVGMGCGVGALRGQYVWTGASPVDDFWSTAANWTDTGTKSAQAPTSNGTATVSFGLSAGSYGPTIQVPADIASLAILPSSGALTIASTGGGYLSVGSGIQQASSSPATISALLEIGPSLTFSGAGPNQALQNSLVVSGGLLGSGGFAVQDSLDLQIASPLNVAGTLTVSGDSTLEIDGQENLQNAVVVNGNLILGNGSGNLGVSAPISGTGSVTFNENASLASQSSYTGSTTISGASTVYIDTPNALPTATDVTFASASAALALDQSQTLDGLFTSVPLASTNVVSLGNGSQLTLTDYNFNETDFAGTITGNGSLALAGYETVVLYGANTYTGGTVIGTPDGLSYPVLEADNTAGSATGSGSILINPGGGLQIGNNDTAGAVSGPVVDNGSIYFARTDNITFSNGISGSGDFTVMGGGRVSLGGQNTYLGDTNLTDGSLADANANAFSPNSVVSFFPSSGTTDYGRITPDGLESDAGSGLMLYVNYNETVAGLQDTGVGGSCVYLAPNATLTLGTSAFQSYSGTIYGGGALDIEGVTQVLSGDNAYTGGTTIGSGTLQIGAGGTSGGIVGPVLDNGGLQFDLSNAVDMSGGISGSGRVTLLGTGGLSLGGSGNTYSGLTSLVGLGAVLSDDNAYSFSPNSTVDLLAAGEELDVRYDEAIGALGTARTGAATTVHLGCGVTLTLDPAVGGLDGTPEYDGVIGGMGALALQGNGTEILTGANTYAGGTEVAGGWLVAANTAGSATGSGTVTIDSGATLEIGQGSAAGSVSGAVVDNGELYFNRPDAVTFSNGIGGSGNVFLLGDGQVTLAGLNTYSGQTFLSGGALLADGAPGSLSPNSSIYVSNGATLAVGFNETIPSLASAGGLQTGSTITSVGGGFSASVASPDAAVGGGSQAGLVSVATGATLTLNAAQGSYVEGSIIGGGAVEVSNGAYLTLAGSATYTGGTTVDADPDGPESILQIGNGEPSGWLVGPIVDNGGVDFDRPDSVVFSAGISGSGAVNQFGSGTLTLAGTANTFSGGLAVETGTLADANAGAFPAAGNLSVAPGAAVEVGYNETVAGLYDNFNEPPTETDGAFASIVLAQGATLADSGGGSFSGDISGNGALTVSGKGRLLQLTGTNTFTGGTTILGATLEIGNGGSAGSLTGPVADSGTLEFNLSTPATFAGGISGTGSLETIGSGTLTLGGSNSYSGSTQIGPSSTLTDAGPGSLSSGGGVTLQGSGSVLDIAYNEFIRSLNSALNASGADVTIGAGATLTLVGGGTHTYAGVIQGAGSLTIATTGTEFLTGDGDLAGTTTVQSGTLVDAFTAEDSGLGPVVIGPNGTLQVGQGDNSGGLYGPITDNGVLNFDRDDDVVLDAGAPISGSGSLEDNGGGTLTIPFANAYTGGTVINNGGGIVVSNTSGSALGTGPVTVNAQSFIAGTGSFSGPLILNSGSGLTAGLVPVGSGSSTSSSIGTGWAPAVLGSGSTTMNGGAFTLVQMASPTGAAGSAWGLLSITGTLTINASASSPYSMVLLTLSSPGTPGPFPGFNPNQTYQWEVVSTTAGITGFNAADFVVSLNSSPVDVGGGGGEGDGGNNGLPTETFANSVDGTFTVVEVGNDLDVDYNPTVAPVPEPSTWVLTGLGGAVLAAWALSARRKRPA